MAAFHFRLEALLKLRRMQEEDAQIKLAQATAAFLSEQERLDALNQQLNSHVDNIRNQQQQPTTIATLKMLQEYHDKIKEDIKLQHINLQQASLRRQEKLKVMEEALKMRKVVEKLREKRFQQHQNEVLVEEQKQLDELGLQIFSRNH
ncbi:MAG: flagellar export protein FliJ [Negativicutes bacterium]|nr:flagellar export protein FliJ [Negativicutes bacterium]